MEYQVPTPGGSQLGKRSSSLEVDPAAGVSVGHGDTPSSIDGPTDIVIVLVDETLRLDLDSAVNLDGGHGCGCSGAWRATVKNLAETNPL
jgi:hypothetical protein